MKITRYINGIIIIDDFYKYPDKIRNFALQQNYKPHNTLYKSMFFNPKLTYFTHYKLIQGIEKIEKMCIDKKIWDTFITSESNGYIQYITKFDKPIIHSDGLKRSMIVYLHNNPHENSGTDFYKHKTTNYIKESLKSLKVVFKDCTNNEKWKCYFTCKNIYNRAILFDGDLYHASTGGFGETKSDARLYQTFFYKFTI
jgi:hypothetical protein